MDDKETRSLTITQKQKNGKKVSSFPHICDITLP
jgi:hypothetical protein